MSSITAMMTGDHRTCDLAFIDVESHVSAGDWDKADAALTEFRTMMLRHFRREEDVLFPALEAATGMTAGPTTVMRMEHDQMRSLLEQLAQAIEARDGKRGLSLTESFMVLVQQHNMKEESILYPMSEQHLSGAPELIDRMLAVQS